MYSRDPWTQYEEIANLSQNHLQREMQDKGRLLSLLEGILVDTQHAAPVERGRR